MDEHGTWGGAHFALWRKLFGDHQIDAHYKAALRGNHISVARMEKFADAVATAKLRGEL